MKKGFTLAELLGVIAILAILSLIAIPLIDSTINKSDENLYQTQLNQIIKGAKNYYSEHLSELPQNSGEVATITLQKLQDEGYLPLDAKNPKTEEQFSSNLTVKVTNIDGTRFEYEVDETTVGD